MTTAQGQFKRKRLDHQSSRSRVPRVETNAISFFSAWSSSWRSYVLQASSFASSQQPWALPTARMVLGVVLSVNRRISRARRGNRRAALRVRGDPALLVKERHELHFALLRRARADLPPRETPRLRAGRARTMPNAFEKSEPSRARRRRISDDRQSGAVRLRTAPRNLAVRPPAVAGRSRDCPTQRGRSSRNRSRSSPASDARLVAF